ncbi:MAG: cupin domain-containing protein [Alphaproteobacteria bacterium]
MEKKSAPVVSHLKDAKFLGGGLRANMLFRDFGVKKATNGRFGVHVARVIKEHSVAQEPHYHILEFQFLYVLKGWMRTHYEGAGEVLLEEGDALLNPGGNPHATIEYSEDCEILQITTPGDYETVKT